MNDLLQVIESLRDAAAANETPVLATVVRTEGSTYRRIGARLVVRADGTACGAISPGCLEGDIIARAAAVRATPDHSHDIMSFDVRSRDDAVWGFGLGCNGLIEVLLEALGPETAAATAERLHRCVIGRGRVALMTAIRAPQTGPERVGAQGIVWDVDGSLEGLEGLAPDTRAAIERTAHESLVQRRPTTVRHETQNGVLDVAYEVVTPQLRLTICGAAADAVPLTAVARQLGWRVTLVDDRPMMASAARFPDVDRIIVALPNGIGDAVKSATQTDAAVIMSHNFESDLQYLKAWLASAAPYIGVLGPRNRTARLIEAVEAAGTRIDAAARQRIHAPIGLDIGADTPEEIAVAIVAEVQSTRAGRSAGHLRDRAEPMHAA